jgi:hypothetical protein
VNIIEVVDEAGCEVKRAASGKRIGVVGGNISGRDGIDETGGSRIARQEFGKSESANIVGAKTVSEGEAKCARERERWGSRLEGGFASGKVWIEDNKGAWGVRNRGRIQNSNMMRNGGRKSKCRRKESEGRRERDAGVVNTVQLGEDVIAKTGRVGTRSGEAGNGRRE